MLIGKRHLHVPNVPLHQQIAHGSLLKNENFVQMRRLFTKKCRVSPYRNVDPTASAGLQPARPSHISAFPPRSVYYITCCGDNRGNTTWLSMLMPTSITTATTSMSVSSQPRHCVLHNTMWGHCEQIDLGWGLLNLRSLSSPLREILI